MFMTTPSRTDHASPSPEQPEGTAPQARLVVFSLPEEREAVADCLVRSLGYSSLDAKIRLRHLPGILPERFDRPRAEQAAGEINGIGGHAFAVDDADVPRLDHVRMLHHVRIADEGFEIVGVSGAHEETLPYASLALLSIGDVPLGPPGRREPGTAGVVIHSAPVPPSGSLTTQHRGPEMWLTTESPFRAFHFEHDAMNYEYLGDRKTTSATANFSELVRDLVDRAPGLFLTRSARTFIGHEPVGQLRFESQDAHRSYVTAQILLMRQVRHKS
jgi:hypothetical protein